jgi:hypothetical protein
MSADEINCELVDSGDLDTRYLAGRLSPEQAEAFEAHFFGCERCWGLVQQGLAVRAAFQPVTSSTASSSSRLSTATTTRHRWWGLAAAAGLAAVVLGVWRMGDPSVRGRPEDAFRGDARTFRVTAAADAPALKASWSPVTDADVYRVRLYSADGVLALERETSDTTLSMLLDTIPASLRGAKLFWQVQALDRLRNPVIRSDLIPAVVPAH